ncbi:MAG: hypothetical protein A2032_03750 [Chloroflexi bacterium RBG_19FT_COMBO_49_13]|nr:MAG: hypothetical protein A2032_03750 [Chloroflexi bacterium RBG_19FT_COMBO_49_13]
MAGMTFKRAYWLTFILLTMSVMLGASTVSPSDPLEQVRSFTRGIEFDYVSWTLNSLGVKLSELALGTANYLPLEEQSNTVLAALDLIRQINQVEAQFNDIYANPNINDPDTASADLGRQLNELRDRRTRLEPMAEAILQDQVNEVAARAHLTLGGQAFPPVLYHTTPPPDALIISPRDAIRQDHDISISPDINVDQMEALEDAVDKSLNVSSLVVEIGGIGLYPTMVMETTDINVLAEVVAHEWVHNHLTLRPLGASYMNSPELRTMNETVASIAGKELGRAVVEQYYPEYLPPEAPLVKPAMVNNQPPPQPVFDFRAEMHQTRVTAERLLVDGKIDEAESYMELRRRFLWDNGYHIRKLNQAYFAFYGAYADQPGGAAGEDPVGAAVRLLRDKSTSLADFINRMSWMWNFKQLTKAVGG